MRIGALLATLACSALCTAIACAHRPAPPTTAVAPCLGDRYVEVHNTLKERAYISIVTTNGRTFYIDDPLAPDETRHLKLPDSFHPQRAEASSEPWQIGTPGGSPAQAVRQENPMGVRRSGVTSRLPVAEGCVGNVTTP